MHVLSFQSSDFASIYNYVPASKWKFTHSLRDRDTSSLFFFLCSHLTQKSKLSPFELNNRTFSCHSQAIVQENQGNMLRLWQRQINRINKVLYYHILCAFTSTSISSTNFRTLNVYGMCACVVYGWAWQLCEQTIRPSSCHLGIRHIHKNNYTLWLHRNGIAINRLSHTRTRFHSSIVLTHPPPLLLLVKIHIDTSRRHTRRFWFRFCKMLVLDCNILVHLFI